MLELKLLITIWRIISDKKKNTDLKHLDFPIWE